MKKSEKEEQKRLQECLQIIDETMDRLGGRIGTYDKDVRDMHDHMGEARRDMDYQEKIAMHEMVSQKMRSSDVVYEQFHKLEKLRKSPYFGRFDFRRDQGETKDAQPVYVGVHDFYDEASSV